MRTTIKNSESLGVFTEKHRDKFPTDTWVVFTAAGEKRNRARLFSGAMSRDAVRSIYSRETNTAFTKVRSRRITNY